MEGSSLMTQQDLDSNAMQGEISLLDILRFLKSAYKTILLFGAAGVVAAISYLAITPKQYEATALIAMAQSALLTTSIL